MGGLMRTITLVTTTFDGDGTYGVLVENRVPLNFRTLERPWLNNAKGISSIPEGMYSVKRTITPLHGQTWEVQNVPGRTAILIHSGNTELDIQGCILLGLECGVLETKDPDTGKVERQPAVLRSKEAIVAFNAMLATEDEFRLNVVRRTAL